ncbi:hypothetical protein ACIRF8_03795 [Streptomyces sp. NPDC102406]|uniref:hypothetical protein n=1 Tax=Streptomyces sp. NPDC102406 TaxID=3366171 RepID=UPI0038242A5B
MDANTSAILAESLRAQGLNITSGRNRTLTVTKPLNTTLVKAVGDDDGRYVTEWDHELGTAGDEAGTARRLAYLLGIPNGDRTGGADPCT